MANPPICLTITGLCNARTRAGDALYTARITALMEGTWISVPGRARWHCTEKPPFCRMIAPAPARTERIAGLYQVGVLIQVFWPPILIQLQQNTFDRVFLNTTWTKRVKTSVYRYSKHSKGGFSASFSNNCDRYAAQGHQVEIPY